MKKVKNSELLLSYIREGRLMTSREKLALITQLSVPSILAQISATVMFFIDASMVGHLGAKASAAIGLVESTGWLLGGLAHAASLGFSVQVAHFIGASDFKAARRVLRQSLTCCLIWAVVISAIAIGISPFLPYWLGGTPEIVRDATLYFAIISLSGIFFQMESLAGSMLKCSGNMKIPSILNITMCLMDVAFNYIFIYVMDLGVMGAAAGTGLAMLVTACLMLYFLLMKSEMLSLKGRWGSFTPKQTTVSTAFKIGAPMGLQHLLMGGAQIVTTLIVAPLGTIAIAAHSLAITVESLCYMPGYGIAEAATTLVGQGIGAGQKALTRSFASMSVVGAESLRIEAWAEPMFAAAIVVNGVFIGAGDTLFPAVISLCSMWFVRLTLAASLAPKYGLKGVWTAMAIELTLRGIIFLARLFKGSWAEKLNIMNSKE